MARPPQDRPGTAGPPLRKVAVSQDPGNDFVFPAALPVATFTRIPITRIPAIAMRRRFGDLQGRSHFPHLEPPEEVGLHQGRLPGTQEGEGLERLIQDQDLMDGLPPPVRGSSREGGRGPMAARGPPRVSPLPPAVCAGGNGPHIPREKVREYLRRRVRSSLRGRTGSKSKRFAFIPSFQTM
jgi:hypothetical protein